MKEIVCIIVDDEPLALNLLEKYVHRTPFLHLAGRCNNAIEALDQIHNTKVDLVFLDIQMPELSGMELSRTLGKDTKIIFTTAFHEYALEGFKVNALDYLLKPFNYEEFLIAANKAKEWFALTHRPNEPAVTGDSYIFVRSEYKQVKIAIDDIIYFEGCKDYVKIWLKGNAKPIMTLISLKALESSLPATRFMRIHRSYIIALHLIQTIERNQVVMNGQVRITIAEPYKNDFLHFIANRSID